MKPHGIPDNYVQTANGVWCHPSRIKKFGEAFCETFPEPMPPEPCKVPWRDDARKPTKRIRQSSKPLMNRLEQEWFDYLCGRFPNFPRPRAQAVRLKIGNGAWYKGDVFAASWPANMGPDMPTIWECKGPKEMKNVDRGILAIKTAATQWPEIRFILVWKAEGHWNQQIVLP